MKVTFRILRYNPDQDTAPHYEEYIINVESPTKGVYQDFTYGYIYELPPTIDRDLIKVASSMLRIMLRVMPDYAISFRELEIMLDPSPLPPPNATGP